MTFLPIVDRELRVAARQRGTYWWRVAAAGIGLMIFGGVLIIAEVSSRASFGIQAGSWLFQAFSWLAFIFACSAGTFLTSDSLSEENREGTLGLLFLTDLRGYDVVLGKLLAHSLRGLYGLLAAFPIIGLGFLLGGVTGLEFWRLVLVLMNTLLFSLTAGVLVSSISRDAQRAMNGTLLVCLIFLAIFPLLDWCIAGWSSARFVPYFSLSSPSHAFTELRNPTRYSMFWMTMGITHAVAWLFLLLACVLAPRNWQEKVVPAHGARSRHRWPSRSRKSRAAWRTRLFEGNPVRWLSARDPWSSRLAIATLLALAILYALLCFSIGDLDGAISIGHGVSGLLTLLLFLWVASQASRFFVDAARTGLIELLLATPLPSRAIVHGQWWGLRRTFLLPALLLLGARVVLSVAQCFHLLKNTATTASMGTAWQNQFLIQQIVSICASSVTFVTGLLALSWFGMWMGLTTRKPNVAVIKTVVFVLVLPWLTLMFVQLLLYPLVGLLFASSGGRMPFWIPQAVVGLLEIGIHLAFILLARRKLMDFRETFAGVLGTSKFQRLPSGQSLPPALPPVPPVPTAP